MSQFERFVIMVINVVELGLIMALQAIHQAPLLKVIKIEKTVSKREKDKLERLTRPLGVLNGPWKRLGRS
jgi:hypothetical protein